VEIGCRNLAKGAMRYFWKIANRGFVACDERFFGEVQGKFPAKLFWEKSGEADYQLS